MIRDSWLRRYAWERWVGIPRIPIPVLVVSLCSGGKSSVRVITFWLARDMLKRTHWLRLGKRRKAVQFMSRWNPVPSMVARRLVPKH